MLIDKLLANLAIHVEPFALCRIDSGWRLQLPARPGVTVHFVLKGRGLIRGPRAQVLRLEQGALAIVPARVRHALETDGTVRDEFCVGPSEPGISYHNIDIGVSGAPALVVACGALFARFGGTLGLFDHLREIIAVDMSDTDQVAMAFRGILAEQSKPDFGGNILTAAMMSQCLVYLFRHLCADPQQRLPWLTALKDPRLGRAVDLILDKPAANHTVDALAQVAGMSRSAFAQHFAASFGYTPMALVHAVRMQRAADLLRDGSMPIDKVCQKVGYASRSHFSRAFKKHIGVSPIEFRGTGESSPVLAAGRLGSSLASGQTAAALP